VILEDDILVLFFSTHGFLVDGDLYLQANDYQSYAAAETSIPYKAGILDKIDALPCRKLVFIDACHSAGAKASTADMNDALAPAPPTSSLTKTRAGATAPLLRSSYKDYLKDRPIAAPSGTITV